MPGSHCAKYQRKCGTAVGVGAEYCDLRCVALQSITYRLCQMPWTLHNLLALAPAEVSKRTVRDEQNGCLHLRLALPLTARPRDTFHRKPVPLCSIRKSRAGDPAQYQSTSASYLYRSSQSEVQNREPPDKHSGWRAAVDLHSSVPHLLRNCANRVTSPAECVSRRARSASPRGGTGLD